jgi:hypothetical protein
MKMDSRRSPAGYLLYYSVSDKLATGKLSIHMEPDPGTSLARDAVDRFITRKQFPPDIPVVKGDDLILA